MIYIDDNPTAINIEAALTEVSEQRREQALRFKFEEGRRLSLSAYLLLKHALLREYGMSDNPVFEYSPDGKPSIVGHPGIHFNLSHCPCATACVVSNIPVGIDVERIRPFKESLGHYVLSDAEYESVISSSDKDAEFIRLWTMKESLLKFTGEGIRRDLKSLLGELEENASSSKPFFHTEYLQGAICTVCCADAQRVDNMEWIYISRKSQI